LFPLLLRLQPANPFLFQKRKLLRILSLLLLQLLLLLLLHHNRLLLAMLLVVRLCTTQLYRLHKACQLMEKTNVGLLRLLALLEDWLCRLKRVEGLPKWLSISKIAIGSARMALRMLHIPWEFAVRLLMRRNICGNF
jgi:hypothetical protein